MGSITDVPGLRAGHISDREAATGCTAVLFDPPATGAVDLRGGGTSTRQIDPLLEHHSFGGINALLFTGGSAYGLSAASGVMSYLEERGRGLDVGGGLVVPSVPTAVIFDLRIGDGAVRPGFEMGYAACGVAETGAPLEEGSVGAGTGASIGKLHGILHATKGGVGTASMEIEPGQWVGVLVVVNAFGDVFDGARGIIAGARTGRGTKEFVDTAASITSGTAGTPEPFENTTLALVATNTGFGKHELLRIARIGQTGITRAVSPSHTISDGDAVFSVSTGAPGGGSTGKADANRVGIAAAGLITGAIISAVMKAESLGGVPSHRELFGG